MTTTASNYHIEINPADAGNQDRFVVQEVIKEIAQSHPLQTSSSSKSSFKGAPRRARSRCAHLSIRSRSLSLSRALPPHATRAVVLLVEVDRLSRQAQAALRRTMEKYTASCRLILCCNNPSKVIDPLRSRCLGVRVPAPSHAEIADVLQGVARKENLVLPPELAARIAHASDRNLRRATLMLQASHARQYPFSADQQVELPDWEAYITTLSREISQEQTPQRLLGAREKLYELLTKLIPADVIMRTMTRELLKMLDDQLKHEVVHWAAFYEHRVQTGSKEIFHLEAFVARFMSLYKTYIVNMVSDDW